MMFALNFDYTHIIILLGCGLLGLCAGFISPIALLKKESMLGDVISHASFPGVVIGFVCQHIFGQNFFTYAVAFLVSLLVVWLFYWVKSNTQLTVESIQAALLTLFFALGVLLLSIFQQKTPMIISGVKVFLFGSAASMLKSDVVFIFMLLLIIVLSMLIHRRALHCFLFDRNLYHQLYGRAVFLENWFLVLMIFTIILGLRSVGLVLMGPLLVFPAFIAESYCKSFKAMIILSVSVATVLSMLGSFLSLSVPGLPTGPIIVLLFSSVLFSSWIFKALLKR